MIAYILFFIISLFFGNAITSFVYRIPRNITLAGAKRKPSCGGCDLILKAKDFLPLYRYFFVSKFCHCGKYKIPKIYPIIELSTAFILTIIFALFNDNLPDLMRYSSITIAILLNIFIYIEQKKTYDNALWILAFCGVIFTLFLNENVGLMQIAINLFSGIAFFKIFDKNSQKINAQDSRFSLILLSICNLYSFLLLFPIFILSFIFFKNKTHLANIFLSIWFLVLNIIFKKYVEL